MNQKEFLLNLLNENRDATIIGSLGTISYELTDMAHPNKLLIRGAMGSVLGIALGYALAKPKEKVIGVIGDGSFLMSMGGMASILKYGTDNLKIVIINNGKHQSTGGQSTNFDVIKDLIPSNIFDKFEIVNVE